jgi:hypothetical protein
MAWMLTANGVLADYRKVTQRMFLSTQGAGALAPMRLLLAALGYQPRFGEVVLSGAFHSHDVNSHTVEIFHRDTAGMT